MIEAARKTWAFIRLTRPVFLLGGALLYALGVAIAASQGVPIRLDRALLGQTMVTAIQLMAHYANEYYDTRADRLNSHRTWFSGGSGVLPAGELARNVARWAMRVCAAVGTATVIAVAAQVPLAGALGGASLLGAWFYSAPPLTLMGSGWGELSTSLIVALLTPTTGFALQAARMDVRVFAVSLPLVLIHLAMLLAFELPDWEADTAAGKRTLAVRLGRERAAHLHNTLIICAFALLLFLALSWPSARYVWLMTPVAAWQVLGVMWRARHGWQALQLLTLGAVGLFALTSALWLLGFISA